MSKPIVLSTSEWDTSSLKFMPPKINERGGMSINVISTQTNRSLHISAPMMMTWGISDYDDGSGGDGKYSMVLNFPNEDYRKPSTDLFLQKVKDFENVILDAAVKNSELWFGEELSREVCKHSFFPFVKYAYLKGTKKVDASKPPSIKARVPCYSGKWGIELYDTRENIIFPSEDQRMTPVDFVPKLSQVACVLQCGGIWKGGNGWGVTWKVIQCVVKPKEVISVYGKCRVMLSEEERGEIETQNITDNGYQDDGDDDVAVQQTVNHDTTAEDSDEEDIVASADAVEEEEEEPTPPPAPKKKVVKKKVAAPEEEEVPAPAPKKRVVKKKVAAPVAEA